MSIQTTTNNVVTINGQKIDLGRIESPALKAALMEIHAMGGNLDVLKERLSNWEDKTWKQWRDGSGQKGCVMGCVLG
jgi:hypothetical protein